MSTDHGWTRKAVSRPIAVLGAPSSIGIRTYDDGTPRLLYRAPAALRSLGLVERLAASDLGDVLPGPYRDFARPNGRPRNEREIASYSVALGSRIGATIRDGKFAVVIGGDCSIVLGALLGVRLAGHERCGLVYVDAHADFATPAESASGSAASMCLALVTGRGETALARLGGEAPLARPEDVALLGRRDHGEVWYGHEALSKSAVLDLQGTELTRIGPRAGARVALGHASRVPGRFWIHFDVDALEPEAMPAVDSPIAGGLTFDEAAELLRELTGDPRALGIEVTIYDPSLDPDGACAERLVALLERVLSP
jgi:arginase